MKIVIEIDNDDYQFIKETEFENYEVTKHLYEAVYDGTPLPTEDVVSIRRDSAIEELMKVKNEIVELSHNGEIATVDRYKVEKIIENHITDLGKSEEE